MKSTARANPADIKEERKRAWRRLLQNQAGIRRLEADDTAGARRLAEIAHEYDRISSIAERLTRVDGAETQDPRAAEGDLLAALRVIRVLRAKLDIDEYNIMALARRKKVTWARIGEALEMSGRQSAERRHLQLRASHPLHASELAPGTQSERVEYERENRSRLAEQEWAFKRCRSIYQLAADLAGVADLADRVSQSRAATISAAIRDVAKVNGGQSAPSQPWPQALEGAIVDYETASDRPKRPDPECHTGTARAAHRLLGLVIYAANPDNIDLSGHPGLAGRLSDFHRDFERDFSRPTAHPRRSESTPRGPFTKGPAGLADFGGGGMPEV